ncbi:hypothetical protein VTJ04DRAFT_8928 [Mycothermus thermophilus]|uniref:uncharacterized protein n=1 Tax=Humicola insolens TaxID=85995 RepID=UPI0037421CD1
MGGRDNDSVRFRSWTQTRMRMGATSATPGPACRMGEDVGEAALVGHITLRQREATKKGGRTSRGLQAGWEWELDNRWARTDSQCLTVWHRCFCQRSGVQHGRRQGRHCALRWESTMIPQYPRSALLAASFGCLRPSQHFLAPPKRDDSLPSPFFHRQPASRSPLSSTLLHPPTFKQPARLEARSLSFLPSLPSATPRIIIKGQKHTHTPSRFLLLLPDRIDLGSTRVQQLQRHRLSVTFRPPSRTCHFPIDSKSRPHTLLHRVAR